VKLTRDDPQKGFWGVGLVKHSQAHDDLPVA
jgi:hypothetical protein